MAINSKKDLRITYSLIRYAERVGTGEEVAKWIVEMKQDVRRYTRRTSDRQRFCCDGIDGYTERVTVPAEVTTLDEAEEWFDCTERRSYTDRGYDCTGQAFTAGHHIGRLGGRMVLWHHIRYDV